MPSYFSLALDRSSILSPYLLAIYSSLAFERRQDAPLDTDSIPPLIYYNANNVRGWLSITNVSLVRKA